MDLELKINITGIIIITLLCVINGIIFIYTYYQQILDMYT